MAGSFRPAPRPRASVTRSSIASERAPPGRKEKRFPPPKRPRSLDAAMLPAQCLPGQFKLQKGLRLSLQDGARLQEPGEQAAGSGAEAGAGLGVRRGGGAGSQGPHPGRGKARGQGSGRGGGGAGGPGHGHAPGPGSAAGARLARSTAMLPLPPVEGQRVVEAAPRPRRGLELRPRRSPCCSPRRPHCSALTVPGACGQTLCSQLGTRPPAGCAALRQHRAGP